MARINKEGDAEIAFGHHRHAVALSLFGKNHQASVQMEDYTDDQMLKAMANENADDETSVGEQRDTIAYVSKFLTDHSEECPRGATHAHGPACISVFLGGDNWPVARVAAFLQIDAKVPDEVLREGLAVKTILILKNLDAPIQVKMAKMIAGKGKRGEDIGAREVRLMAKAAEGKSEKDAIKAAQQIADNATEAIAVANGKTKAPKDFAAFLSESDWVGRQFAGRLERLLDPELKQAFDSPFYWKHETRQRLEATCRKIQRFYEKLVQVGIESQKHNLLTTGEKQ